MMKRWLMRVMTSAALASLGAVTGPGALEASPGGAAFTGQVWLAELAQLDGRLEGTLSAVAASELEAAGGALLVSGRADVPCQLEVTVGAARATARLGPQPSVVHLELTQADGEAERPAGVAAWSLSRGAQCQIELEGAVLFVGEAATYVGDDPQGYWSSLRSGRARGVR